MSPRSPWKDTLSREDTPEPSKRHRSSFIVGLLTYFFPFSISNKLRCFIVWLMSFPFLSACPITFTQVGCFHDSGIKPRPLPQLLFTDHDKGSNKYSGKPIHWGGWDLYLSDLVCRCAEQAKAKGYNVFGVQHYGKYPCTLSYRRHFWPYISNWICGNVPAIKSLFLCNFFPPK